MTLSLKVLKVDSFICPLFLDPELRLVEKTPICIFSTFGSKINEFERKKLVKNKKFQKPKSLRQLP